MSIIIDTDGHLALGCNSTSFFPDSSLCDAIGGKWEQDIKWCRADNATVLQAMQLNASSQPLDVLNCKTANKAQRRGLSPVIGVAMLLLIITALCLDV
jgi:flagellin-like protein